ILVSEVMLQQTPVNRVLPAYLEWMRRWPSPAELAADTAAAAIRAWARLGYPRRALRLHACAVTIVTKFNNKVPDSVEELLKLPGIGSYTACAVAAFAFGQRQPVVDVNVRRVLARAHTGAADPGPATTKADVSLMERLLPQHPTRAARFAAAAMELGATVCTARTPSCEACPLRQVCAWIAAGRPNSTQPRRRSQGYEGTDRQARGRLMAILRDAAGPVNHDDLAGAWHLAPG
ncbi:MAG: A/G-specific adenine glycosylase, partial [Mycobacteriales bacterium]